MSPSHETFTICERRDQPRNDQRQDEVTLALCAGDKTVELDAACDGKRGGGMTVGQRADDFEALADGRQFVAAQKRPQRLDLVLRPIAEIGERAVLDPLAVAIALARQDGRGESRLRTMVTDVGGANRNDSLLSRLFT